MKVSSLTVYVLVTMQVRATCQSERAVELSGAARFVIASNGYSRDRFTIHSDRILYFCHNHRNAGDDDDNDDDGDDDDGDDDGDDEHAGDYEGVLRRIDNFPF